MILFCLANITKTSRMKEAEQIWLVARSVICFILFGCYSILKILAVLIAEDYGVIALLCTSIISIILVFNNHIQSMSLRTRQRGNTFGMWLTHPSVSQEFIFWLWPLLLCHTWAVVTCQDGWEKLGFSLRSLLACVSVIPWWHKAQIGPRCSKFGCYVGKQLWWEKSDTAAGSEYCAEVWQQTSLWQWKVLNGTSLQLGETSWKPTAHALLSLHFDCTESNVESELSRCYTALLSLSLFSFLSVLLNCLYLHP